MAAQPIGQAKQRRGHRGVLTDLLDPQTSQGDACKRFGEDKVFVPRLLRMPTTVANRDVLQ